MFKHNSDNINIMFHIGHHDQIRVIESDGSLNAFSFKISIKYRPGHPLRPRDPRATVLD